jgi:hypothetical protein
MRTRLFQVLLSTAVTLALVFAVVALVTVANPMAPADRALADGLGGILGQQKFTPLIAGTTRYTTSVIYSSAAYVGNYGSVQIMAANTVTGSQVITVTPQFSLQDVTCSNVTQWYSATSYLPYQPYSIVSSATTVTETVGAWSTTPVVEQFTVAGSNVGQREVSATGTCFRAMVQFGNAGQSYTPTLVIRALNRN